MLLFWLLNRYCRWSRVKFEQEKKSCSLYEKTVQSDLGHYLLSFGIVSLSSISFLKDHKTYLYQIKVFQLFNFVHCLMFVLM